MGAGQLRNTGARQFLGSEMRSVLFVRFIVLVVGLIVLPPAPASASNMWFQQAIVLIHVPLGGGMAFTTNYVFTASDAAPTTVNVKCFNESGQRVGPIAGVNVELNSTGQVRHLTPAELLVLTDPLFTATGIGWCWANNNLGGLDYNVQITIGATSDMGPNGILNSPNSTAVGTNTGLGDTSRNVGGVPFFTTIGGVENYIFLLNPTNAARTVNLQLFDALGTPQGAVLVRNLPPRDLDVLLVPQAFGLSTPPTSGSVRLSMNPALPVGTSGYTGWFLQPRPIGSRMVFVAIGLDGDFDEPLSLGLAP
jgi:hypothetical protein